jgi:hypothetical protein
MVSKEKMVFFEVGVLLYLYWNDIVVSEGNRNEVFHKKLSLAFNCFSILRINFVTDFEAQNE